MIINILKANERIKALEAENATLASEKAAAEKLFTEHAENIEAKDAEIGRLKAELEKAIAAANVAVEANAAEVEKAASAKALEIVASQGVKPITATAPATAGDVLAQLNAIEDPAKRQAFFLANRTAIFNAGKNQKKQSR